MLKPTFWSECKSICIFGQLSKRKARCIEAKGGEVCSQNNKDIKYLKAFLKSYFGVTHLNKSS